MLSRNSSINITDYDVKSKKYLDREFGNTILIFNNKVKKENVLCIRSYKYIRPFGDTRLIFTNPSLFNLNGVVKSNEIQYPAREELTGIIKCIDDDSRSIVSYEYMKHGTINKHINQYLQSKGSQHNLINPTVRSKIIYGVAAIMNRLHQNEVLHQNIFNHIYLDDKLEPRIKFSRFSFIIKDKLEVDYDDIKQNIVIYSLEHFIENDNVTFKSDVFQYAFFLYSMFDSNSYLLKFYKSKSVYIKNILSGHRPPRLSQIPDAYWELIERIWNPSLDPSERPSFKEITEILKDDKFALEEFGMKTDLNELHAYQRRIDNDQEETPTKKVTLKEKDILKENEEMKKKIKNYESFFLIESPRHKIDENCFIDDDEEEENYKLLGQVGEGATSITYKVIDERTKQPLCKKIIKYKKDQTSIKDAQNVIKEFQVLYSLNHPCICKAYRINMQEKMEIFSDGKKQEITTIALFLEFVEYGLDKILNMKINNTMKVKIVIDIVHALKYLHSKGIMHRDVKLENIMLNSVFETKIVDFGLVGISENALNNYSFVGDSLTRGVGTLAYMSPEMINEEKYDNKTDVYSFGVVLHAMFLGSLPKQNIKDKSSGKKISMPSPSDSLSKFGIKIISKCLSPNPKDRPSFEQILNEMRKNSYGLAADIDPVIISKRDQELDFIEKFNNNNLK